MSFIEGQVICINKPLNWTSFQLVAKIRNTISKEYNIKKIKVGHAGTLDPLATGVMIVCTGKKTKEIDTFQYQTKEYVTTIKLGEITPSYDAETEVTESKPIDHLTDELITSTIQKFTGEIQQIPPEYSAVKVNGKRAYELARAGEEVQLKPKTLVIDEIEVVEINKPFVTIRVVCSKGTYIRALGRDIGETLGVGAYLTALQRTKIGDFTLADCIDIEEIEQYITKNK